MKTFNRIFATVTAGLVAATLALTAASFAPTAEHHDDTRVAMIDAGTRNG